MNRRLLALLLLPVLLVAATGCALRPVNRTPAAGTVTCDYRPGGTPAKPVDPPAWQDVPASGTEPVTFDLGDVKLQGELDRGVAPCTVNSFASLVTQGFYTGSECHRLSTSGIFILQCGDPTGTGSGTPGYVFDDEVTPDTTYPAGTIAMANMGRNTNGSQFFFVYADTPLPPNYTVFGHLDQAATEAVAERAFQGHDASNRDGTGRPLVPTVLRSVTLG
ncbi:peptidylprolyl isomerase [Propioniciclava coleopterorum]|uniref:Peptidyl-prolyl cis-trans isomerase n=1 Tax=Propioniciclava coleopterorum TaxID=2714937 RepID=A0A6G7Y9L8_9ACTN|nr:peptidylprolyl isomerase [Propioniciclava coleopterorum]QIK73331.1 peptidylprolyl isomerase [Propioniciclava coleopterorum]